MPTQRRTILEQGRCGGLRDQHRLRDQHCLHVEGWAMATPAHHDQLPFAAACRHGTCCRVGRQRWRHGMPGGMTATICTHCTCVKPQTKICNRMGNLQRRCKRAHSSRLEDAVLCGIGIRDIKHHLQHPHRRCVQGPPMKASAAAGNTKDVKAGAQTCGVTHSHGRSKDDCAGVHQPNQMLYEAHKALCQYQGPL